MKSELQAALHKARRFLQSAKLLKDTGDYDSAASRLYYAMFYCAEALLLCKGMSFKSHHAVISAIGEHFAKTSEMPAEMHRWLIDAFDKRQAGDYETPSKLEEQDIVVLQPHAEQFVSWTEQYLKQRGLL
jgi:uncharacterized protein (UPF0332 family)